MKLLISVARQLLTVFDDAGKVLREYPISTAKAGVGEISGSYQTPRGRHVIRAKIGASQPENTMRRYVYIHGSPDTAEMGIPGSHGCVRMRNADIVELFDLVPCYSDVEITED